MKVQELLEIIGADFYTGVPDSQLKALCDFLMEQYGVDRKHHIIAANEGNCVGIAAGYYLSTKKIPVIYMQNSGQGNSINPITSLLNEKVYAIPSIFIIGWRGEPNVHDEPQHVYQGEITLKLLKDIGVESFVIEKETTLHEIKNIMQGFNSSLSIGKSVAFVIRKGALSYDKKIKYKNEYKMNREEIIKHIVHSSGNDIVVSTTGKASRELFEIRNNLEMEHKYDFLTVGSMGHASSIAMGIAIQKEKKKVWCIDGDGAVLMHMGAMAVIGQICPQNLVHIVINNGAHETVGGMPTVGKNIDFVNVAEACGYEKIFLVETYEQLDEALKEVKTSEVLSFIEVKCAIGAREDLGRPTATPVENKINFMEYLNND